MGKKDSKIKKTASKPPMGHTEYVYRDIEEYEKSVSFKIDESFRAGWNMARRVIIHFDGQVKSK